MQSARPEKAVPFVFLDCRLRETAVPLVIRFHPAAIYQACRLALQRSKSAAKFPLLIILLTNQ